MPIAPFLAPERDGAFKRGRAKGGGVNYYVIPGVVPLSVTAVAFVLDTDYYQPVYADTPVVVDQLAAEVATTGGSGNFRMGLYRADTDWQPLGAPLADSGSTTAAAAAVKTYTPGTPLYLPRGRYVTVFQTDNSTPTYRVIRGSPPEAMIDPGISGTPFLYRPAVSRTYAAFPTPGTAWDQENTTGTAAFVYPVFLRVTTP